MHVVNVSGGKDSTAVYLLALRRGRPFRAIMADTGNEQPVTVEYAERLGERTGGPAVEIYRADFSEQIARKRDYVALHWPRKGVPLEDVERALQFLVPTGNPFLDLCIWKGRFPSRKAQFCTEFLKERVVWDNVIAPALAAGPVVQWLGVRRDESAARASAPFINRVRHEGLHAMTTFRPLIHWTAQNVFALHKVHGLDPNPLYREGMSRVGCFPCINANKDELREIGRRYPEAVEKILEWERIVRGAAKRQAATFFAPDVTPEGADLGKRIKRQSEAEARRQHPELEGRDLEIQRKAIASELSKDAPWPRADEVFAWARTGRGGRQHDLLRWLEEDEGLSCSSQYGLCE